MSLMRKTLNLRMSMADWNRFKILCLANSTTMNQKAEELIIAWSEQPEQRETLARYLQNGGKPDDADKA